MYVLLRHVKTAFTKHHIVSAASSKTGIAGTLQHHALFICRKNNGSRCDQLCRSLGQAWCWLSGHVLKPKTMKQTKRNETTETSETTEMSETTKASKINSLDL